MVLPTPPFWLVTQITRVIIIKITYLKRIYNQWFLCLNGRVKVILPRCWNGIQDGLKNHWSQGHEGSTPSRGTDFVKKPGVQIIVKIAKTLGIYGKLIKIILIICTNMNFTEIIIIILLAVIAYILWCIYRQKEEEKEQITNKKFDAEWEAKKKEEFKDYPHLYGKLEGNWLEVFALHAKNKLPLLKLANSLWLEESVQFDPSEGDEKWYRLWDLTEELLEHLEKYHGGSVIEHEIAVCTYWQIASEAIGEVIKESRKVGGNKLEVEPYTNIEKIVSLFPKKANHPAKEITFTDEKGSFPRESKGSDIIKKKLKDLGL